MTELIPGILIKDGNCSYQLVQYIGSGSYGEVWQALDVDTGRNVAIKFYIMLDEKGRQEFFAEYETASVLRHENLLTALYVGEWEGRPFLVMPYCSHGTSSKYVGRLAPSKENERLVWRFIHDVAAGLAHLHSVEPDPIVHQDIKPDNILIDDDDHFVITDFGISVKIRSTMRSQSMRTVKAGAVAYMGPERFAEKPMSVMASDIWSLGASIYELVTGELPFCGMGGGMQNHGAELPTLGEGWSESLNDIVRSCLAKNTWDRIKAYELEKYASDILEGKAAQSVGQGRGGQTIKIGQNPSGSTVSDSGKTSKKGLRPWIWLSVAAAVVLIFIFGESSGHKYARTSRSDYLGLVSDCISMTNSGSSSDYDDLLSAKEILSDIKDYELLCGSYYPDIYKESSSLEKNLQAKLRAASDAWAKAAESQYNIGNESRSLEYYRLANRLYSTETVKTQLHKIVDSMGYMSDMKMKFGNWTKEGSVNYPDLLKASDIQYLCAQLEYKALSDITEKTTIHVKVFTPSGSLSRGDSSPKGYTYSQDITISPSGKGKINLTGWGTDTPGGYYSKGVYRWEIWHKGKQIYTSKVTLN